MSKPVRYIYVFDLENNLVKEGFKNDLQKDLNINEETFRCAIRKKSLWNNKYYFSTDKNFKIEMKRADHNPFLNYGGLFPHKKVSAIDKYFRTPKENDDA